MDYFLGIDEIDKIKESNVEDMTCVAQYYITDEQVEYLKGKTSVKNLCISGCKREIDLPKDVFGRGQIIKTLFYPGLSSVNESLDSMDKISEFLKDRVQLRIEKNVCTFLSVCNDAVFYDKSFDFENREELRFDHAFTRILQAESNESYLAVEIGGYKQYCQEEVNPSYLLLIQIFNKNTKENMLKEIFRTKLDKYFPNFKLIKIIFNKNISSKLLLIMQNGISVYVVTFNISNLQFSTALKLEEELSSKLFYSKFDSDGSCGLREDNFNYLYHNILKDIIIIVLSDRVYVVKQQVTSDSLFIYKSNILPNSLGYNHGVCTNRNNEIILFYAQDIELEDGDYNIGVLMYDILKNKLYEKLCDSNGDSDSINFNDSGEEIFIVDENKLMVFVYKSKVRSLKSICQMLVLEQYTSEQLNLMSLPRNILISE